MTDLRWDAEYIKLLSPQKKLQGKGSTSYKKNVFFRALPKLPLPLLPPIRATCTTFLDVKNDVLARITELSITTMMGVIIVIIILLLLRIFVFKMNKMYTHNMILMSSYKGQLHGRKWGVPSVEQLTRGGKKGEKEGGWARTKNELDPSHYHVAGKYNLLDRRIHYATQIQGNPD